MKIILFVINNNNNTNNNKIVICAFFFFSLFLSVKILVTMVTFLNELLRGDQFKYTVYRVANK